MWRIIKAEVLYHKYIFLTFLAMMPLLVLHEMMGPVERVHPALLIWILVFLPVNTWVSVRSKDKRELQYVQLPVPAWRIGAARIAVVLGSALASAAVYGVLHFVFAPSAPLHLKAFMVSAVSVVFIYSMVFIVGDRVVGNRRLQDAKLWITILLSFMVMGNVYLLILTRRIRPGMRLPAFIRAVEYVFEHHPFSSDTRIAVTMCVVVALALLSVWSFTRRKTQVA